MLNNVFGCWLGGGDVQVHVQVHAHRHVQVQVCWLGEGDLDVEFEDASEPVSQREIVPLDLLNHPGLYFWDSWQFC